MRRSPQFIKTWSRETLPGLIEELMPEEGKAARTRIVKTIRDAAGTDDDDAARLTFEALLDALELQGLLVTLDKQQLRQALEDCQRVAKLRGVSEDYAMRPTVRGENVLEIASDFAQWLEPRGYQLLWVRGSVRSAGDDEFPFVFVPAVSETSICEAVAALGAGCLFSREA